MKEKETNYTNKPVMVVQQKVIPSEVVVSELDERIAKFLIIIFWVSIVCFVIVLINNLIIIAHADYLAHMHNCVQIREKIAALDYKEILVIEEFPKNTPLPYYAKFYVLWLNFKFAFVTFFSEYFPRFWVWLRMFIK